MNNFLPEIGISIIVATILAILSYKLKQPVILGYVAAGAIIGPEIGFKLVSKPEDIEIISEIGLILLLFIIGLEMDPRKILGYGKQLFLAGLGQFPLCVLVGIGFFMAIGYKFNSGSFDALYLSIFCAVSSTAIVIKLLYDKLELDTFPGRMTLGILIFQDIWAIIILTLQPIFQEPHLLPIGLAILKSLFLLGLSFFLSKYVLKTAYQWISKTPEMVVALAIAWCALISGIASLINLSPVMGALVAGISISSFPYSMHLTAKILPLRDFFLTLFFISLGMKIPWLNSSMFLIVLAIVIFVIFSRFLIIYPLLSLSGSGVRTSFITSLNLAQISEFSLIIASLAVGYGHIQKDILGIITYSMVITAVISSYFINYNHQIFQLFSAAIRRLGIKIDTEERDQKPKKTYPIIILGFHRGARALIDIILRDRPELLKDILVIDFNLEILKELESMNIAGVFGDVSSMDTLTKAGVNNAKVVLSTIPNVLLRGIDSPKLIEICRSIAPEAVIIANADFKDQIEDLKRAGADEVLLPYAGVGELVAGLLQQKLSPDSI